MSTSSKKKAKRAKSAAKQGISKSTKKKATKKKTVSERRKFPAEQGKSKKAKKKTTSKKTTIESKVGYKNPPKEHQFPPGQSGNPKGPPIHRVNLWPLFCGLMNLTDAELDKLDPKKMTQAQHSALRLVEDMKAGKYSGSQRLARHVFDREEGRPVEHVVIEPGDILTDEECDQIRQAILSNNAN
jgi:hypothetical protein